jgi:photosystem II stability/assembly factor-like uncharacterized protein
MTRRIPHPLHCRTRKSPRFMGQLRALVAAAALASGLALSAGPATAQQDLSTFGPMSARSIGPAGMSGRTAAVAVVRSDPDVIWVGGATGGVWKSTDGGLTFVPVFDDQPASSIGAIAISQANPDVVWVGTGESNVRNSAGVGRGVWKSIDGGRTWQHLGLDHTEHIGRIVLDPTNPDVAYVAALGPEWSDGEQRGVFRTTDGGQTWQKVLYVGPSTGAADVAMDPSNPQHLLAGMWQYRRRPWTFTSGGPGSGLYVTYDGGDHWTRLTPADGLPDGDLGRIGLAFAAGDPAVVYALVEAKHSAMLRSDDGGASWHTASRQRGIDPRPFYYSQIRVDPTNENRIYRVDGSLDVSEDAGRTWRTVVSSRKIHGDVHDLWLSPDGMTLIQTNDGGVGISPDRGRTWRFVANLPLAQYYHINVDDQLPYHVLGGLQDNGSWVGPAYVWHSGGIRNYDFQRIGGGDGFEAVADPTDPRYVYGMSQQGSLFRFDRVTGGRVDIQPTAPDTATKLRFNWNAAIALDPFRKGTVYFGSQFVHETDDHGATWQIISPDLTTNNPAWQKQAESGGLTLDATGAENYTTIITIAPSPVQQGVIWVGTDDGNVQLTRDGGKTWTNVIDRIKGVPANTWVPHIEASHFDAGTAYVVFDDHRRGNWETYVYRTTDFGRSWDRLAADGAVDGFARVVEEDPSQANLLWLGTEFGLWVSTDRGRTWAKWTHGVPTAPVFDLATQPREHDLVVATHGRAVYVIDDVRPLEAIAANPSVTSQPLHVFTPPTAYQHAVAEPLGYRSTGDAMFFGQNRAYGAMISFWLSTRPGAEESSNSNSMTGGASFPAPVHVRILDGSGAAVRSFDAEAGRGFNRLVWDLRRDGVRGPEDSPDEPAPEGPEAPFGDYTVQVIRGADTASAPLHVAFDPRSHVTRADREAKVAALMRAARLGVRLDSAMARIRDARQAVDLVDQRLKNADMPQATAAALRAAGDSLRTTLDGLAVRIVGDRQTQGITDRSGTATGKLYAARGPLSASLGAPTPDQLRALDHAEAVVNAVLQEVAHTFTGAVSDFRRHVTHAGLTLIPEH